MDTSITYLTAGRTAWQTPTIALRCVKEARPSVLGIHLIRYAAGAIIGARVTGHWLVFRADTGAVVWWLAIFSVYVFNGVMDVKEDRINGSGRPIATGALSRRTAAWWTAGAAALSLVGAGLVGMSAVCVVLASLLVGWQYSGPPWCLKRTPAGVAAAGAALGFLGYAAGFSSQMETVWKYPGLTPLAFVLAMSAWLAFIGAPAKDLSDVRGDAAAGRRTLALAWGETAARRFVAATAWTIAIGFSVASAYLPLLRWPAGALLMGALAITVVSLSRISTGSRSRRRMPYRIFMLTQYAATVCLLAATLF